ncbi:hypothetical protein ZTR_10674 [Talaromyces verruculosus]|nr:hypothetical protein ZTR_10674 [Talaromyces verruculosus]
MLMAMADMAVRVADQPRRTFSKEPSYTDQSRSTGIPASTLWRRANGKPSKRDKVANQQYLTPQEERALVDHVLRMAQNGYPLPISFLRSLAVIIARSRRREKTGRRPFSRHPELRSRRLKPIDWKRDDRYIEEKVHQWFGVIGRELADPSSAISARRRDIATRQEEKEKAEREIQR